MVQQIEDPALSLQWLRSLLWCGFSPWTGNFNILWARPKKKKKKKAAAAKLPLGYRELEQAPTSLF